MEWTPASAISFFEARDGTIYRGGVPVSILFRPLPGLLAAIADGERLAPGYRRTKINPLEQAVVHLKHVPKATLAEEVGSVVLDRTHTDQGQATGRQLHESGLNCGASAVGDSPQD